MATEVGQVVFKTKRSSTFGNLFWERGRKKTSFFMSRKGLPTGVMDSMGHCPPWWYLVPSAPLRMAWASVGSLESQRAGASHQRRDHRLPLCSGSDDPPPRALYGGAGEGFTFRLAELNCPLVVLFDAPLQKAPPMKQCCETARIIGLDGSVPMSLGIPFRWTKHGGFFSAAAEKQHLGHILVKCLIARQIFHVHDPLFADQVENNNNVHLPSKRVFKFC